jgi:tetratricopeptide (TPR) repeat protein
MLLTLSAALGCFGPCYLAAQDAEDRLALHQQRAQEAEANQDFETAIREYRLLVQMVPNNAELESNLGVALYFHRDLKQASEVFRLAVGQKPSLYAPHLFLGLTMAQMSRPDDAVPELEKASLLNRTDPLVHTWLGYEYTAQSRFEKAAEELEAAAREVPDDPDVRFALGRCYLELGKEATGQLLQVAPDGGRAWELAGEQYEAQGNTGKALKLYGRALSVRPDIAVLRERILALGGTISGLEAPPEKNDSPEDHFYGLVEKYEREARESFEQVSRINPESYRAHQVLADSDATSDHYDDAIKEYRIVLSKKPDLPGIHGDLCNALSRTAQIKEAVKECDAETSLSRYSADAYVQAARVHLLVEDDAAAGVLLERALMLDRPPILAYKLLGKIELSQKHYTASIKAFTKYLAVDDRDASAYFLLARAYKAEGNTSKMNQAIADYKKRSEVAKGAGEAQRTLDPRRDQDTSAGDGAEN